MNNKKNIFEYIGKQSYKDAIEGIDKAYLAEPYRKYYLYLKGYCFSRLGNYFRTISLCKQALECGVESEAEECYLLIGQSYEYMDWFEEAEDNYLLGLKLNPNNSEIKAAYAYLLLKSGYTYSAYSFILEALRADPDNTLVNHYVVYFYLHSASSNFERYKLIKSFVDNSSNEILKLVKAGKSDAERQRHSVAMRKFEKAYLLDPDNESIADYLDELRLRVKLIYKPLVLFDILGSWGRWGKVLGALAFITLLIQIIQKDSMLNIMLILTLVLWAFIGAYKYFIHSFYWKFYSWK
ncbi:MAG: hypothetical protein H7Y18_11205 [Clostridiaceae bacterium]|nr:hypothetical protein [Clostridiaceae bacterium]